MANSKTLIQLVGASYEAIKIMHHQRINQFLFNTQTDEACYKGSSRSAALNKWLKQYVPDAVIRSLRHSFRDKLSNPGVQSEMIDQLGGWSNHPVGKGVKWVTGLRHYKKYLLLAITCDMQI